MRILTIAACPFPTRQGSQLLIRQAAEALAGRGHDVRMVSYAGREATPCRVPVHRAAPIPGSGRLRAGPSLAKPFLDAGLALTVLKLVRRLRPDVIHAHNVEGAMVGIAAARGVPVVFHAHALMEAELPTYFPGPFRPIAKAVGHAADRALPARVAATITLTERGRDAFVRAGGDPGRIHVIPPGIDVPRIDPAYARSLRDRLLRAGERLVLYCGNADAYQGLQTLLDATRLLPARLNARFVFALTGGTRDFSRAAAAHGPADRMIFLDASWRDTAHLLATCDAAVVPRADAHGFPMKLLNILALGTPAVVHAACAHGLGDAVEAILAQDARGFAAGLEQALEHPDRARRMGEAGRRYVQKHHDWSDLAPRIEAVLAKAARPARTRRAVKGSR